MPGEYRSLGPAEGIGVVESKFGAEEFCST